MKLIKALLGMTEQFCVQCQHSRRWHSRNGCGACPCPLTYNELGPNR